jgi:hypothetical protein
MAPATHPSKGTEVTPPYDLKSALVNFDQLPRMNILDHISDKIKDALAENATAKFQALFVVE